MYRAGNYPDYFDDPTRQDSAKSAIDPQWKRFCCLNPYFGMDGQHFWPAHQEETLQRIPLMEWYFENMINALRSCAYEDFVKFSGCLSHLIGDFCQTAHLAPHDSNATLEDFLPRPFGKKWNNFHYHTSVEAIYSCCKVRRKPKLLGGGVTECAWRLAEEGANAVKYCRRFLIPTIQAIFRGDMEMATKLSEEPASIAAELSADSIYSAFRLAANSRKPLVKCNIDLIKIPPVTLDFDMVYGGIIINGNRDVSSGNASVVPGYLLKNGSEKHFRGFGMLPGSGMKGERSAGGEWLIPAGVFSEFNARVGVNYAIPGDGAVIFSVECDGREKWRSPRMTRLMESIEIRVALEKCSKLRLKVYDANDGKTFWKNHAFWAKPVLIRKAEK